MRTQKQSSEYIICRQVRRSREASTARHWTAWGLSTLTPAMDLRSTTRIMPAASLSTSAYRAKLSTEGPSVVRTLPQRSKQTVAVRAGAAGLVLPMRQRNKGLPQVWRCEYWTWVRARNGRCMQGQCPALVYGPSSAPLANDVLALLALSAG